MKTKNDQDFHFCYISAMFIIHRGQPTPFFFSPTESFMGLFMFSLLDFGSTYETFEVQELSHLLKVKATKLPTPPIAVLLTNATLYLVNYLVGHFNHFEFRAQNLSDCAITVMYLTLVLNFVKSVKGDYIYIYRKYLQKGKILRPQYFEP